MSLTFESQIDKINIALAQHSHTWTLKARPDMDYHDVSQIIRLHIYKKWNQWDQERDLEPWIHTLISRQIINIRRNVYTHMARPCLQCPSNLGDDQCNLYIKQCSKCPLFATWENTKKRAFNVKLPLPIENHTQEINNAPHQEINYNTTIPLLQKRLKIVLSPTEWKIYQLCYIDFKTDREVAQLMDFKYEKTHKRYKRLSQIQESIYKKAQKVIKDHGLD